MGQPNAGFRWNAARERAAVLVAEDDLSDEAIAKAVGIGSRATLARWKEHPDFQARVAEHVAAVEAAMLRLAVAKRRKRIAILNEQAQKIRDVIAARATDPLMADVPGGSTGLLVAEPVLIKVYESNDVPGDDEADGTLYPTKRSLLVHKFAVDTGTLKELRATLEQAAKELGQWTERREVSGKDGGPVQHAVSHAIDLSSLSDEELRAVVRITDLATGDAGGRTPGAGDPASA